MLSVFVDRSIIREHSDGLRLLDIAWDRLYGVNCTCDHPPHREGLLNKYILLDVSVCRIAV